MFGVNLDVRVSAEGRLALTSIQRKLGVAQVGDVLRTLDHLGLLAAAPAGPVAPRRLDGRFRARVDDALRDRLRTASAASGVPVERMLDALIVDADAAITEGTKPCRRDSRATTMTTASTTGRTRATRTTHGSTGGPAAPLPGFARPCPA